MTKLTFLAGFGFSAALLSGCQSGPNKAVPIESFSGTVLDQNEIGVKRVTEILEVNLNPLDDQLRLSEIERIKSFLSAYNSNGHGSLVMALPKNAPNPHLAIQAVAEARDIAWEAGIEYQQISGSAYDARGRARAPLILAYTAYKAQKPKCTSLAEIDIANAVSNSDLPSLGCAVRTNMAAIIADPADLYGTRELEPGDQIRRQFQIEAFRSGQPTAAERGDSESGAVSTVVE